MHVEAVLAPGSGVRVRTPQVARKDRPGKRTLDLVLSVALLILLAPLFALTALAIWASDRGPVFYGQIRIGREGRDFRCWKFRSMVCDSDAELARVLRLSDAARAEWARDRKLRADPRITFVGSFLRRSSLDELPQLWNVVRGDMSMVGPRPIVVAERGRYGARFDAYCACRPGLTGLWQVSGRNDTRYRRRIAMDAVYARKASLRLDVVILALTIPAILLRRGSY